MVKLSSVLFQIRGNTGLPILGDATLILKTPCSHKMNYQLSHQNNESKSENRIKVLEKNDFLCKNI